MIEKAIFLDRDGVLINNHDHYYIWKTEQMNLVDGVPENLLQLAKAGFSLFIVSNQGGIAKGLYSREDTESLHYQLIRIFESKGIHIVDIAYCPHHPEIEKCLCRKPSPLMLDKLMAKYQIDSKKSFMIGDSESDMEAAKLAGVGTIRINANQNMQPFISFLIG